MTIQIDTREKPKAIQLIKAEFDRQGIEHFSKKLDVGDYMNVDNPYLIIDRKQNLGELVSNVCQQHKRFNAELVRAQQAGVHLIFLVEHSRYIKTLGQVRTWRNPRLKTSPCAMSGERLYKVLCTLQKKYGVGFIFCDKKNTGKKIIEILGGNDNG